MVAYLDRINIGYAQLQMKHTLPFDGAVYGLGAGIFFIGYFLFEVPSNLHAPAARRVADFIRDMRTLTEPVSFDIEDILTSDSRAAIIGALQNRIKATGKIIATQFAIILTITGDVVTRLQMLEESFDVSKAAPTLNRNSTNSGSRPHPRRRCSINPRQGVRAPRHDSRRSGYGSRSLSR
jgi:hypothetical protein